MRVGEFLTAGVLAVLSIYMMWKSTELHIGYISDEGPGGGAWPFWLSAIMLICTIFITINAVRKTSPPSQSNKPALDYHTKKIIVLIFGAIVAFVALSHVISMYGAMMCFLFYYLKILGKHTLRLSISVSLGAPILFFFFFEALMRITLPKGLRFTDPFFNILYEVIY